MDLTKSKLQSVDAGSGPRVSASPMDVNNHCSPVLVRKAEVVGAPTLCSPIGAVQPSDADLQHQLLMLKHQQQYQQRLLFQQFHQQQQLLARQHNQEIQYQIQSHEVWEKQKEAEEIRRLRETREAERIEMIKHKKKDEESAIASSEVKQLLAEVILKKQHQESARNNALHPGTNSPPQLRQWAAAHHGSLEQQSPPQSGTSPPYHPRLRRAYEDFPPLRKAASEPNLKVRSVLKQKVIERRSSPLLKRKDKAQLLKRKTPLTIDTTLSSTSSPESGPNSPLIGCAPVLHDVGINQGLAQQQHQEVRIPTMPMSAVPDLSLYTSPSMPNISLGKPCSGANTSVPIDGADVRLLEVGHLAAMSGLINPAAMTYYKPSLPVIDGDATPPSNPAYIASKYKGPLSEGPIVPHLAPPASKKISPLASGLSGSPPGPGHHMRIQRHRPLERTHSAPLPLGKPLFTQHTYLLQQQQQQQHEQYLKEQSTFYVKQHVRQTVLQRVGSKNQMENVDEETEAKLAQEMREAREKDRSTALSERDMNSSDDDIILVQDSRSQEAHDPEVLSVAAAAAEMNRNERQAFLQQYRDKLAAQAQSGVAPSSRPLPPRPLSRTHSSPLVTYGLMPQQAPGRESPIKYKFATGLAYDTLMLKHQCVCGCNISHPEHAGRLQSIWARLQEARLVDRCERVKSRKATIEELQACHSEAYSLFYGTNLHNRQKLDPKLVESLPIRFLMMPCGGIGTDSDTVWNEIHTSHSARMAAGCVIELAFRVAQSELRNGFAIVRPPGHHAEINQPMGFCYFNSIAIAARLLQRRLKVAKILIVDWDVHHGNGTQQMFYDDERVLYISLHRHDNGNFFPGTGAVDECGTGAALGYNVNVPWSSMVGVPMGDAEYMAAFRTVVMPIAALYDPDVVLVSAGFDAAFGHIPQLGGYKVSPACFAWMTQQLMTLAGGKLILALEGGYDLPSICDSAELCVQALVGDEVLSIKQEELCRAPCKEAIETLSAVLSVQSVYWPSVLRGLSTLHYPWQEAIRVADTVDALASMSMTSKLGRMGSSVDSEPMEES